MSTPDTTPPSAHDSDPEEDAVAGARCLALEIAVVSAAGAIVARDGGADRVELCTALELGGVTPSQGLVEAAVATGIPVHALVRSRPGDFVYDDDELATMLREVRLIAAAGVAGVVVGALDAAGLLDATVIARFADAARTVAPDVEVTVHRAIDHTPDPIAAAGSLPRLGVTRVLTSGGAPGAPQGIDTLRGMVGAAGPVQVQAGGGVSPPDIDALAATGIAAVHMSAKRRATTAPASSGAVRMGVLPADRHFVTDPAVVGAARRAVDAARQAADAARHAVDERGSTSQD
ncbi:copper homeostasis protein CutC [Curtobacterium sp. RRHDQ10]|uniref:copper homeostasis protein CutC n=1 Tax=Curtobacterium phyllosphaerae TaxID=3413379 RepID=UPI003BF09F46